MYNKKLKSLCEFLIISSRRSVLICLKYKTFPIGSYFSIS